MSEQLRDQISAFVDGELPAAEAELLIRRLEREVELKAAFARFTVIGESMRAERGCIASHGFAARVTQAVAAAGKPDRQSGSELRSATSRRWLRPVAGVAVAATVAGLAIFGLQRLQIPAPEEAPQLAANTPAPAAASAAAPVVIGEPSSSEPVSYTVPEPAVTRSFAPAARLTSYVVAHSEYSSPLGRRNVLSSILAEDPTSLDESGSTVPANGVEP